MNRLKHMKAHTIRGMLASALALVFVLALPACGLFDSGDPVKTADPTTTATTRMSQTAHTPTPVPTKSGISTTTAAATAATTSQTTEGTTLQTTGTSSPLLERWPAGPSVPEVYTAFEANPYSSAPLAAMTVLLDAGHGGKDPGAVSGETYEKTVNLEIASKTRLLLEAMGARVVMLRSDDTYLSIYNRVAKTGMHILDRAVIEPGFAGVLDTDAYYDDLSGIIVDNTGDWDGAMVGRGMHLGFGVSTQVRRLMDLESQFNDTIFVSIHANSAFPDTEARGLQIFYSPTEAVYASEVTAIEKDRDVDHFGYPVFQAYTYYDDAARSRLAGDIFTAVAAQVPALGTGSHAGVRQGNYGVLRENNLASVLVEAGYLSNPEDKALLLDGTIQFQIAQGVANGILAYFTENS